MKECKHCGMTLLTPKEAKLLRVSRYNCPHCGKNQFEPVDNSGGFDYFGPADEKEYEP